MNMSGGWGNLHVGRTCSVCGCGVESGWGEGLEPGSVIV